METNSLGQVIKQRRLAKKLTLRQLTAISGVSLSHLARIERGERFPSASVLRTLVEPLGFTEVELFKTAGFLSQDGTDGRVDQVKKEIKREIAGTLVSLMVNLHEKIDSL